MSFRPETSLGPVALPLKIRQRCLKACNCSMTMAVAPTRATALVMLFPNAVCEISYVQSKYHYAQEEMVLNTNWTSFEISIPSFLL